MTGQESLEVRIAQRVTTNGSAVIPPRIARWLEQECNLTAGRRYRLRSTDVEAYEVLSALHLAALCSDIGTNHAEAQQHRQELGMWLSTSEAAKALNVTDRCVRNWCKTGRLHAVQPGSRWLINRNTLNLLDIA